MKLIESRDNPTYKTLLRLAGENRAVRELGKTFIEGPHLVAMYRQAVGEPTQVVVSQSGLADPEIAGLAGPAPLVLKDALFRQLSGLAAPAGISAVIDLPAGRLPPPEADCVVLDALQDAGNVGSILRSAAAAGLSHVVLGKGCAGAWTPRVLRAAQGAHFRLHLSEGVDLAEFLAERSGKRLATVPQGPSLFEANLSGTLTWMFGNEGQGLTPELLALATDEISIPMAAGSESINVAAAAAICLFDRLRRGGVA